MKNRRKQNNSRWRKVFKRKSDGFIYGNEIYPGYTCFDGKSDEPHLEVPEDFEEVEIKENRKWIEIAENPYYHTAKWRPMKIVCLMILKFEQELFKIADHINITDNENNVVLKIESYSHWLKKKNVK